MKATDKIIIYDDSCPLCEAYTAAFVKSGMISPEGRRSFSDIDAEVLDMIDNSRCKDEIPLLDTQSGQVFYGIDALVAILQTKMPYIKTIASLKPVNWFIRKLYKLISYNRRVIVAGTANQKGFDCTPHFNTRYRWTLIFIGLLFNTVMLFPIHAYIMQKSFIHEVSIVQLQISHSLFVASNFVIAKMLLTGHTRVEYLGQINMLATITILLCIPLLFLNAWFQVPSIVNNIVLTAILLFIVKEYKKRMQFAGIFPMNRRVLTANFCCLAAFIAYILWVQV